MTSNSSTRLIICALGIFVCYFYFGMLQEKITRGVYGDEKNSEKFTYMFSLVFFQCVVNYVFSKFLLLTVMKENDDSTKTVYYAFAALTYLLGMVSSNMALSYVSYPTQVVGKAAKPIPVLLLGVLLGKKSYSMRKYLFTFMIVAGVILFMFKDGKSAPEKQSEQTGFGGELLIFLSLMMDGFTSAAQERMRAEHKSSSGHMMMNMNFWSMVFSGTVIALSGEMFEFFKFVQRHPNSLFHIMSFSTAGALGQFFIFRTVSEFGPLPCSIITTTRKFFTVLSSVLLFGNTLILRQWLGTFIVFSALFLDALYSRNKNVKKDDSK
ncbi:GSCOCG00002404001-RA-CDS [Cotesia congregata]|uniref:Similar to meigo: Solute carrier family 35 member B1 homolog (Drosophila melanogaster) n=1 Tax=Cotesia congregata TaxID=51543 RepID=A0A8J2MH67_COTCN|nr:GSCOCG00002404001-RA-CDS [Cotesia congregata]CAG5080914.1 Similar to meigo: Solute carrier family 35 member B1 homolog (Drosophila melanogaster) [Cotesia congregata]